ncbi:MAG: outer membrane beta-barrel protein [Cyanobacteriota bacterium]|nr:outer membrane beta-barrel protein [Cyanobacteriota bacterium]
MMKSTPIVFCTLALPAVLTSTAGFARSLEHLDEGTEVAPIPQFHTSESFSRNLETEARFLQLAAEDAIATPPPVPNFAQTPDDEATTAAPLSTQPVSQGAYGALSADWRFFSSVDFVGLNIPTVGAIGPIESEFNSGFGINGSLGYKFPSNIRVEGQISYGRNAIGDVNLPGVPAAFGDPVTTPLVVAPGTVIPAGTMFGTFTLPVDVNVSGIALNPGTPPTLAQDVTVPGGLGTIPAGTPIPDGIPTTGGTTTTPLIRPELPAATVDASGSISTLSGLFNVYYDLDTQSNWQPYIGGGIGVSRFAANNLSVTYPGTTLSASVDDSTLGLVYQLMAGVGYYFNPRTAVTVGYRYFDTFNTSFDTPLGEVDLDGVGIHNLEVGLRYFF